MVCTIGQMASPAYYLNCQRSQRHPSSYYSVTGEEPDGVWWNPDGLFDLPDGGKVTAGAFQALCDGYSPDGDALTALAGSARHRAGFDVTFSADKSISALWALADPALRAEIERAHYDAAREAMRSTIRRYCSFTRIRPEKVLEVVPGRIFGALWQHGTSRENDPQLHTHCTILNLVLTDADQKWRALHAYPIYQWQKAAGATYRAVLATHLSQRLGIRMERHGRDGSLSRVVGMPKALIDRWSKRRATIEELARARGVNAANGAAMQNIIMETRDRKSGKILAEARHIRWALEATETIKEDIGTFIKGLLGHEIRADPERDAALRQEISEVPIDLTRHDAVFNMPAVIERVANVGAGIFGSGQDINREVKGLLRRKRVVKLDGAPRAPEGIAGMAHTRYFSTNPMIEMEAAVRDIAAWLAQTRGHDVPVERVSRHIDELLEAGYPLSDEQVAAIHYSTSRGGALAVIEGAAGSGKTTTLRPIADLHRSQGRTIVPIAVAWATATPLGADVDARPYSVKMMFRQIQRRELKIDRDTVIIVDEAGLLPTHEAHRLIELVERSGAKLIAVGDTRQQQPVEAGPGLRLITEQVGSVRVDKIRRQLPDAEDVLRQVHGMDVETARLRVQMMSPGERRKVVDDCDAMPNPPEIKPWQIAMAEAFRDGSAADGIAALHERGRFHVINDAEPALKRIAADWATWQEENPGRTSIVLARTHGETRALSHYIREHVLAETDDEGVNIDACQGNDRTPSTLNIRVGDRLRIGTTLWSNQLFNGSIVEVVGYRVKPAAEGQTPTVALDLRTETGREVTIDHDQITDYGGNIRLGYGYCITFASAQGRTVDQAFVLIDDAPAAETTYPVMTRHRERLDVYVVARPILETIRRFSPEDMLDRELGEADVLEHLAASWSRSNPKVSAHDHMSGEQSELYGRLAAVARAASRRLLGPILRRVSEHTTRRDHRHRVAGLATAVADLDRSWADLRTRYRAGGDAVVMSDAWRSAHDRQRKIAGQVRAIHDGGGVISAMLGEAGVDRAALSVLEESLARRSDLHRSVAAKKRWAGTRPAADRARGEVTASARDKARGVAADPAAGDARQRQLPLTEVAMAEPSVSQDVTPAPEKPATPVPVAASAASQVSIPAPAKPVMAEPVAAVAASQDSSPATAKPVTEAPVAAPASAAAGARNQTSAPPRLRAGDLSARLAEQAEAVCRHYLAGGQREGVIWRVGGLNGAAGKSMWVNIAGERRGRWADAATGESGDMLDLLKGVTGGSTREAMAEAARFLGHSAGPVTRQPTAATSASPPKPKQDPKLWRTIYDRAQPLADDDVAGRYLASRGLSRGDAPGLRLDVAAPVAVKDVRERHPAILAPMTTPAGDIATLYAIFLTPEGAKAAFDGAKRFRSSPADAAVWFGNAAGASRVLMTEGVEDAIAAWSVLTADERKHTAVAAAGGTRFHRVALPDGCRDVVLLQDRDEAGERAWTALQKHFAERPVALSRVVPQQKDVNAELIAGGAAAVRRILAPALRDREAQDPEPAIPPPKVVPAVRTKPPDAAPKTVPQAPQSPSGIYADQELMPGVARLIREAEDKRAAAAEAASAAARAIEETRTRWQYGLPVDPALATEVAWATAQIEKYPAVAAVAVAGPPEGEPLDLNALEAALGVLGKNFDRIWPLRVGHREIDDVVREWAAGAGHRIPGAIAPEVVPQLPLRTVVDLTTPASEGVALEIVRGAALRRTPVIAVETDDPAGLRVIRRDRVDTAWKAAADPHADTGTPDGEARVLFARLSNYRDEAYARRILPSELDGYSVAANRVRDLMYVHRALGGELATAAKELYRAVTAEAESGLAGFLASESSVAELAVKRTAQRADAPTHSLSTGRSRGMSM